jgi:hypothetical protein
VSARWDEDRYFGDELTAMQRDLLDNEFYRELAGLPFG